MPLIGYAWASTENQLTARQLDELRAAGCTEILEEHASGGDRSRPVLAQTLAPAAAGRYAGESERLPPEPQQVLCLVPRGRDLLTVTCG